MRRHGDARTQHSALSTQHSAPRTQDPGLGTQPSALSSRPPRGNWLLLAASLAVLASTLYLSDGTQWGPEPRADGYPAAGARYIREAGLQGNLFNSYTWGGFLVWAFYPERRVFIDGRADLYGDAFVEEFRKVYEVRPGWQEVLDRHSVGVVMVERDGPLATLLASVPAWREVFRGDVEIVFVRSAQEEGNRADDPSTR